VLGPAEPDPLGAEGHRRSHWSGWSAFVRTLSFRMLSDHFMSWVYVV